MFNFGNPTDFRQINESNNAQKHLKCSGACGKYFSHWCAQSEATQCLCNVKGIKWFCDDCEGIHLTHILHKLNDIHSDVKQCMQSVPNLENRAEIENVNDEKAVEDKERKVSVVEIDLGTTRSRLGVFRNGNAEVIADIPSYVAFDSKGDTLIGEAAKEQQLVNPENTIYNIKRFMGRDFGDPVVQSEIKSVSFKVIEMDSKPYVQVGTGEGTKEFAPEQISAMIISELKKKAENYLNETVTHAVISCPANFNNAQRQATIDAAEIANLKVMRLINEPSAAVLSKGYVNTSEGKKTVLVLCLGAGSFDVSLITVENGKVDVIATEGDSHLGGEDFSKRVLDYLIDAFSKKVGEEVRLDSVAIQKLRKEVDRAKCELSSKDFAIIEISSLLDGENFSETLHRTKFEELNADSFISIAKHVANIFQGVNINKSDVNEILLAGASAQIPKIERDLEEFFGDKELEHISDDAIILGSAKQAAAVNGIKLTDITPASLGVGIINDEMSFLIPRNTKIPAKKSGRYTTFYNNQTKVIIDVFEGESKNIKYNNMLDEFTLCGITPMPAGKAKIQVTFEIDQNGILKVKAKDFSSGNTQEIKIDSYRNRLTQKKTVGNK